MQPKTLGEPSPCAMTIQSIAPVRPSSRCCIRPPKPRKQIATARFKLLINPPCNCEQRKIELKSFRPELNSLSKTPLAPSNGSPASTVRLKPSFFATAGKIVAGVVEQLVTSAPSTAHPRCDGIRAIKSKLVAARQTCARRCSLCLSSSELAPALARRPPPTDPPPRRRRSAACSVQSRPFKVNIMLQRKKEEDTLQCCNKRRKTDTEKFPTAIIERDIAPTCMAGLRETLIEIFLTSTEG